MFKLIPQFTEVLEDLSHFFDAMKKVSELSSHLESNFQILDEKKDKVALDQAKLLT